MRGGSCAGHRLRVTGLPFAREVIELTKIVCPECGATSFEGYLTYPLCHGCHQDLSLCQSPDSQSSSFAQPLSPIIWVSALMCTVFGLIVSGVSFLAAPPPAEHKLTVSGSTPRQTRLGDVLVACFVVENQAARTENVKLRLRGRFFRQFRLIEVNPQADFESSLGSSRYLYYTSLGPQERLTVQMKLLSLKAGEHEIRAEVLTDDNQCVTVRQGVAVLPQEPLPVTAVPRRPMGVVGLVRVSPVISYAVAMLGN